MKRALILVALVGCSSPTSGSSSASADSTATGSGGTSATSAASSSSSSSSSGSPLTFTPVGPTYPSEGYSGVVNSIAVHPTDPNTMLIAGGIYGNATSMGVYRTTDHGTSWTPVMSGLVGTDGLAAGTVDDVWIDPKDPTKAFAGTAWDGTFRSTDGGVHWKRVDTTLSITRFAYANGTLFAGSAVGVLQWNEVSGTWSNVQATPDRVETMTAHGTTALAGTTAGDVYQLKGGTWSHLGTAPSSAAPAGIHALAINPTNPMIVYAAIQNAAYAGNLYVSADGGVTWAAVANPVNLDKGKELGVQAIAFTTAGRLYVACDGKMEWAPGDGNLTPSYTPSAIYNTMNPPGNLDTRRVYLFRNTADTEDICVDGSDWGIAVANTCSKALTPITALGGTLSTSLVSDFGVSSDEKNLVATLQDFNAATRTGIGATWVTTASGENGYAAIHPTLPSRCYIFGGVFRYSTDGCSTFAVSTGSFGPGPSSRTANVFAFDPSHSDTFYVLSVPPAPGVPSIQRTLDNGADFTAMTPTIWPFQNPSLIAIDPANGKHILAADGSALQVSTDGGTSWKASTGLPTSGGLTVAVSPRSGSKTVLAAVIDWSTNTVSAHRSVDGGLTFKATLHSKVVPTGTTVWRADGGIDFGGVVYSPSTTAPHAVITTLNGAYMSADDGDTWERIDTTLTTRRFTSAHFAGGHLYLGSWGQGILRSDTPVE